MLLESQYSQFKDDLNVAKPKGGVAFITDFDRKNLLAITHQAAGEELKEQGKPIAMVAPARKPAVVVEGSDLPKFEDD